jgi:eukaryotic-like serine/threonine-protein kinase
MQVKLLYSRHHAGISSDADFRRARDAIEHDTIKRLGGRGRVWEIAVSLWLYAEFAESPDEISDALPYIAKAAEAEGTLQHLGGRVGKVYLMAGKTDAALVSLRRVAAMCNVLSLYRSGRQTIAYMHDHLWFGEALEAKGDKPGACEAYAVILDRWKNAKPRSVTVEKAKERSHVLGCKH